MIIINGPNKSLDIKFLKNSTNGEGVQVRDDTGLIIKNSSGSNSISINATGASQLLVSGSITLPTLNATTSVVTPLINSGASSLSIQTNGITRLTVDPSGNIGNVFPNHDGSSIYYINNDNATGQFIYYSNGNARVVFPTSDGSSTWEYRNNIGTAVVVISSNGSLNLDGAFTVTGRLGIDTNGNSITTFPNHDGSSSFRINSDTTELLALYSNGNAQIRFPNHDGSSNWHFRTDNNVDLFTLNSAGGADITFVNHNGSSQWAFRDDNGFNTFYTTSNGTTRIGFPNHDGSSVFTIGSDSTNLLYLSSAGNAVINFPTHDGSSNWTFVNDNNLDLLILSSNGGLGTNYSGSSNNNVGTSFNAEFTGSGNAGILTGMQASTTNASTGTVTNQNGILALSNVNNGGATTYLYNIHSRTTISNNSSVLQRTGIYIANPSVTDTSSITTNYGIYVEDQTTGATNYSIYSAGGPNYFGGSVTAASLTDSALTSGRITYAGTAGLLQDSSNLTFDGTYLTAGSIKDSALTSGRVTYAGTGGLLQDSSDLTFDGTTLTAKAAVVLSTDTGVSFQDGNGSPVEGMKIRVLSVNTTDATVTEMTVDGSSLTLANGSLHSYVAYISAKCTGGTGGNTGLGAMFKFELAAKAAAGIASILPTPIVTVISNERSGVWTADITNTSNKIQIIVTGDINDNVSWSGWVQETTI